MGGWKYITKLADKATDLAAIIALTYLGVTGEPSMDLIAAIVSVAIGEKYARGKWLTQPSSGE